MATSVRLRGVGKRYAAHHEAPSSSLKDAFLSGFRQVRRREWRWALQDIDLDIAPGTSIGLIGPNGAGKTSLLRLIGGVGRPDAGRVEVPGRVGALLELGTGFHPDLSGRESAVLAMIIAGRTRRDAVRLLPEVAEFAGLEGLLHQPLRTYSSGMVARLAFAVATSVEPDLLLIDEVLAVGDLEFQHRCLRRIEQYHDDGVTVVLVSHDPSLVAGTCQEVAWLQGGRLIAHGRTAEVLDRYVRENEAASRKATPAGSAVVRTADGVLLVPGENRVGSQEASISAVRLLDRWGLATQDLATGAGLVIEIAVDMPSQMNAALLAVRIVRSKDRAVCIDTSTTVDSSGPLAHVELERLDLAPGHYDVEVGLFDESWCSTHDHHSRAYSLRVSGPPGTALLAPPLHWRRSAAGG